MGCHFILQLLSLVRPYLFVFGSVSIIEGGSEDLAVIYVSVLPVFSSTHFIVSGLTFRSLIHFEFIFVYSVRKCSNFMFLHIAVQFSQHHLLNSCFFLHFIFLPLLSRISCP